MQLILKHEWNLLHYFFTRILAMQSTQDKINKKEKNI